MAIKPAFAPSAQIEHAKYGLGSVVSCTEEYIVIKFDDHGEKKFVLSICMPALKKRRPPAACGKAPLHPQKGRSGSCHLDLFRSQSYHRIYLRSSSRRYVTG